MKKTLLFLISTVLISSAAYANDTVRLAIGDWAPYTSQTDAKGKLLERVVTEAFKLEGIDVKYDYFPWKRSYMNAIEGSYDGTFPWNKTADREKNCYIHKISLIKDESVFFHLKSKPFEWNTLADLRKYTVGVALGFKQEKIYSENGIKADQAPDEESCFKKLLAGRIDVYQTSKTVGYVTINKLFSPAEAKLFTNHPKAYEVNEYYVLFSKKTANGKQLADKLDSGLRKLKESGAYDRIIAEYVH